MREAEIPHTNSPRKSALIATLLQLCLAASSSLAPVPLEAPIRAIHLSTHGAGRDWGSAIIEPTMADLRAVGANWVAIHPYARVSGDGSVRFRGQPRDPSVRRPIEAARAAGLKILIKPHLAYWGSPFGWRGEIEFGDASEWERFWREYRAWILWLAEESEGADAFIIGTELDRTLSHEETWRQIIEDVRRRASMPLSYAANWTDFERVPFWDQLDFVAIQAYFPIADSEDPPQSELDAGWAALSSRLAKFSRLVDRPIVLSELGYNWNSVAALRPWEYHSEGETAEALQLRCFRAALAAIEAEPAVLGAFLWKWFPEPYAVGRNFPLATDNMKALLREYWLRGSD
jgi:hypothetical protein